MDTAPLPTTGVQPINWKSCVVTIAVKTVSYWACHLTWYLTTKLIQ